MTQYRNKFATHKTEAEKRLAFSQAVQNDELAYFSNGKKVPLYNFCLQSERVEFIGGLWRVQDKFPYDVQKVRDIEVVLADKIPHSERIPFEYYRAYRIGENCYGRYLSAQPDTIVAKYEASKNCVYWGYGNTIEQARAFLGIKLFDEHMDLIHATACRNARNNQKK